jgi:hypothetical protein
VAGLLCGQVPPSFFIHVKLHERLTTPAQMRPPEPAPARRGVVWWDNKLAAGARPQAPQGLTRKPRPRRGAVHRAQDCADTLACGAQQRDERRAVWRRARARALPRRLRGFAWMLLHEALPCGGSKVSQVPDRCLGLAEAACCSNATCKLPAVAPAAPVGQRRTRELTSLDQQRGSDWQFQTLLHALVECPAVRPGLQWLAQLWSRTGGGPAPPLPPKVWLQDSPAAWRPAPGSRELWAHLRLAVLKAAWRLRCVSVAGDGTAVRSG